MHWQRASPSRSWTRFERQAAKQLGHGGRLDFNFDLGCQLQRTKVFAGHAFSQWVFARTLHDHADMRIDHDAHHTWPILSADGAKRYFGVGQFRLCGAQLACGNCLLRHSFVDAFFKLCDSGVRPHFHLAHIEMEGARKTSALPSLGCHGRLLGRVVVSFGENHEGGFASNGRRFGLVCSLYLVFLLHRASQTTARKTRQYFDHGVCHFVGRLARHVVVYPNRA